MASDQGQGAAAERRGGISNNWRMGLAAGLGGALLGAAAMALAPGGVAAGDKGAIEKIVRDYILENPEIIQEAASKLHERELAKSVQANRALIETPFASAWAGDANGDVVLVEFFDYACGYCRKSVADVDRLLAEDKRLKVVWRELPVLGPDSVTAAQASLSAAQDGKFRTFYKAMYDAGRPTAENIAAARRASGVAAPAARVSHQSEIDKNYELARAINASGTPTFVIGDKVLQGAVGYEALKAAVAEARAKK